MEEEEEEETMIGILSDRFIAASNVHLTEPPLPDQTVQLTSTEKVA